MSAVIVLVLGISACSGLADSRSPETVRAGAATLEHAGPWRADFEEALDSRPSDFEQAILADGRITAQELESAHDAVERCLADSGFSIEYADDGGFVLTSLRNEYSDDFFAKSDPALRACEGKFDEYVTTLYQATRRNPDKLDEATISVACLRRSGLVDSSYSEAQFREDADGGTFPFPDLDPKWKQCDLDPLGLWRTP